MSSDREKQNSKNHYRKNKIRYKEIRKKYYVVNSEEIRKKQKVYRENNKDKIKENAIKNKLKIKEYRKKYNQINKERMANQRREYYIKNKHVMNAYSIEYYKKYPERRLSGIKRHFEKYGKTFNMNSNEFQYALQSWSKTIKKLDNYMCKNCSSKENLHSHHIKPKILFPELALDLDNGVTLCKPCHEKIHGYITY